MLSFTKFLFVENTKQLCFSRKLCFQNLKPVSVLYSESCDAYENLALENLFYEKHVFDENKRFLFLWRNKNCVVIGRHQNPWKEVNLRKLRELNIQLCRRMSGGGSVFHDLGNINFTFLTNKSNYNRIENLDFIISVLKETYNLDVIRNEKDDILLDDTYKISGTAAKIGLKTAYHHCTLLCSTNLKNLSSLLRNPFGSENIKTNATSSIPSKTRNVFTQKNFDFQQLLNVFSLKFYSNYTYSNTGKIVKIDPKKIPGIHEEVERISSWDWIYGKSPKFTLTKQIKLLDGSNKDVILSVNKGVLQSISFGSGKSNIDSMLEEVIKNLEGVKIEYNTLLSTILPLSKDKKCLFYCNQILEWFDS